jgi:hypothetical protein
LTPTANHLIDTTPFNIINSDNKVLTSSSLPLAKPGLAGLGHGRKQRVASNLLIDFCESGLCLGPVSLSVRCDAIGVDWSMPEPAAQFRLLKIHSAPVPEFGGPAGETKAARTQTRP